MMPMSRSAGLRAIRKTTTNTPSLPLVLANYWHQLGLLLDPGDANDVETVSAIIRITGGNFRLIERLMTQVARVMEINQLDTTLDPERRNYLRFPRPPSSFPMPATSMEPERPVGGGPSSCLPHLVHSNTVWPRTSGLSSTTRM